LPKRSPRKRRIKNKKSHDLKSPGHTNAYNDHLA
jgi:hypothetical protein